MEKSMKVEQFYNKNQFVILGNGQTVFQSYESTIAIIDQENGLTLGHDWDYSKTTMKHLYLFLVDYKVRYAFTELRHGIESALNSSNKRKALQDLIDKGIINYDKNL